MAETTPMSERTVAAIAARAGRSYFSVDRVIGELGIKAAEKVGATRVFAEADVERVVAHFLAIDQRRRRPGAAA